MRLLFWVCFLVAAIPISALAQSWKANSLCGWTQKDFDVVAGAFAGTWKINANTGEVRSLGLRFAATATNIPPALITYENGQLMINLETKFPLTYATGPNWNLSPPKNSPAPRRKFLSNLDISAMAGCDSGMLPRLITRGYTSVGGVKTYFVTRLYVLSDTLMYGATTSTFNSHTFLGPIGGTQIIVLSR